MHPVSYKNVMVDLETTGTSRDHSMILQIAAATFDLETQTVGSCFCINLGESTGRFWDASTQEWWRKQPSDVFEAVTQDPQDPGLALEAFRNWVDGNTSSVLPTALWGKPISFEYPFLESYFRQYEVHNPFHYRHAIDMQSFIRGMRGDPNAYPFDKEVPFEGDAHNALHDVFHQIRVVIEATKRFRKDTECPSPPSETSILVNDSALESPSTVEVTVSGCSGTSLLVS